MRVAPATGARGDELPAQATDNERMCTGDDDVRVHTMTLDEDDNEAMHDDSRLEQLARLGEGGHDERMLGVSRDDFDQLAHIGEGGQAPVWLVRHKTTGDLFAMKVIEKHKLKSESDVEHVLRERAVLSLEHPLIIRMHHAFQDFTNLYFVMEYANRGDMFTMIGSDGLVEPAAKFYFREIAAAVFFLHENNVIVRDIKAEVNTGSSFV